MKSSIDCLIVYDAIEPETVDQAGVEAINYGKISCDSR